MRHRRIRCADRSPREGGGNRQQTTVQIRNIQDACAGIIHDGLCPSAATDRNTRIFKRMPVRVGDGQIDRAGAAGRPCDGHRVVFGHVQVELAGRGCVVDDAVAIGRSAAEDSVVGAILAGRVYGDGGRGDGQHLRVGHRVRGIGRADAGGVDESAARHRPGNRRGAAGIERPCTVAGGDRISHGIGKVAVVVGV